MTDKMNRIFMWIVPRTISTAIAKCLSFVEGTQVINEPYDCAYHVGPDCKDRDMTNIDPEVLGAFMKLIQVRQSGDLQERGYEDSICTYAWIRDELLEAPYENKKVLICKSSAFSLNRKYDMLPKGFKHSFLIRHPYKVFSSWKKLLFGFFKSFSNYEVNLLKLPDFFFPSGYSYKELYELVEYVEKTLGQEIVIVDTDDILSDPSGVLSAFCQKMDLPYSPDLLSWEAGEESTETWIMSKSLINANIRGGYHSAVFGSSGFKPPSPLPTFESLDSDVQACASASLGYYDKLYARRIKPTAS